MRSSWYSKVCRPNLTKNIKILITKRPRNSRSAFFRMGLKRDLRWTFTGAINTFFSNKIHISDLFSTPRSRDGAHGDYCGLHGSSVRQAETAASATGKLLRSARRRRCTWSVFVLRNLFYPWRIEIWLGCASSKFQSCSSKAGLQHPVGHIHSRRTTALSV